MNETAPRPKLFFLSLIYPALKISVGSLLTYALPDVQPGTLGAVLILLAATYVISRLFYGRHRRQPSTGERWRLMGYCALWALVTETWGLWYLLSFPEEAGVPLGTEGLMFVIAFTVALNLLFCFLAFRFASPRYIDVMIKKDEKRG